MVEHVNPESFEKVSPESGKQMFSLLEASFKCFDGHSESSSGS